MTSFNLFRKMSCAKYANMLSECTRQNISNVELLFIYLNDLKVLALTRRVFSIIVSSFYNSTFLNLLSSKFNHSKLSFFLHYQYMLIGQDFLLFSKYKYHCNSP